jgi:hypothetical protein
MFIVFPDAAIADDIGNRGCGLRAALLRGHVRSIHGLCPVACCLTVTIGMGGTISQKPWTTDPLDYDRENSFPNL